MTDLTIAVATMEIPQGTTFFRGFALTDADTGLPADTSGWQARCEVRTEYGGDVVTRFHSNGTWDGTITFDGAANMILKLTAAKTALLTPIQNAVFDVEMIDPLGQPWRVVQGYAHVTPEATTDV